MKLAKKIIAAALAAATALTMLTISAFANDVIGTNPTMLKDGVELTEQIPYDDTLGNNAIFDNGGNYLDFRFTAPASGTLKITYDISCDESIITCFRADDLQEVGIAIHEAKTGSTNKNVAFGDSNTNVFSGCAYFKVEKGEYNIRVRRNIWYQWGMWKGGFLGNGRLHLTAEMEKPEAPKDIKVTDKTDTTLRFQWAEPDNGTSYDLRYKAKGASKWTTVSDIMDNNVTVKKLKASTKYTYQMRTHAGDIIGDWSESASVKTADAKNVKFAAPVFESKVTLTWKSVAKASGYKVRYSTDKKNWKTVTVEDNSCELSVSAGKTYYVQVAAKNSAKTGPWSKTQTVKLG